MLRFVNNAHVPTGWQFSAQLVAPDGTIIRFSSQITLTQVVVAGEIPHMPSPAPAPIPGDSAPVAGAIRPSGGMGPHIEGFLAYLGSRKKAPNTIARWRHMLTTTARDAGWTDPQDVTYARPSRAGSPGRRRNAGGRQPRTTPTSPRGARSVDGRPEVG